MNVTLSQAASFFNENDNFTILCHSPPDGDTLGSGYALCGALQLLGKNAQVLCDEVPSSRFDFLKEAVKKSPCDFEAVQTVVTVDVADVELLGGFKEKYFGKYAFCVDHHISNKNYAAMTLLDTTAAACAEIIWDLIKELKVKVTPEIAAAVYTGVSTDTGCFKHSNTTARSHSVTAELLAYGFDHHKVNYLMFEMKTRKRVELERQVYEGIEYYFGGKCAVVILTAAQLDGVDPEDAGNISSIPKQIEGVVAGVVIKHKKSDSGEKWKISVRTNKDIDAQVVCSNLGGGGHVRAAGCTLKGDVETVKSIVIREIGEQLSEGAG